MRSATLVLPFLAACVWPADEPALPEPPAPTRTPAALRPALDAVRFDCDGDDWTVSAEVAGRADLARAVVVRTEGDPLSLALPLTPEPLAEGALWQRFSAKLSDPALPCDRAGVAVIVEADGADGARIGCAGVGHRVADLAAGRLDARLGAIPRGDWRDCRVPKAR